MQQKYLIFKIVLLNTFLPFLTFGNNLDLSKNVRHSKISVLTCDPGNEIYSLFGHSALRIENSKNNLDLVVNWGLFEFSENQFQFGFDFAKGRLIILWDCNLCPILSWNMQDQKEGLENKF